MDATIVSFLPYELNTNFPGILPYSYSIPKAPIGDFVVVHISDAVNYVPMAYGQPPMARAIPGEQIAGSIAQDHINSSKFGAGPGAFPGIKALPGKHDKDAIKDMFEDELEALLEAQKRWFRNLVSLADDLWKDPMARGKNKSISDTQRAAANYLRLEREWSKEVSINLYPCPVCTTTIPVATIKCPQCSTVLKPEEMKKFELAKEN